MLAIRSEFNLAIDHVEGLVVANYLWVGVWPSGVEELNLPEDPQHVTKAETENESCGDEPEKSQTHGHVADEDWHFVSHVEVLLIVDVIGSVLENEVVEGSSAAKVIQTL